MGITSKIIHLDSVRKKSRKPPRFPDQEGSAFGKGLSDQTMKELANRFSVPESELDYRNRAIFTLMSKTGMRAKEVISLKFSNILKSPDEEILIKYRKKGGKIAYSVLSEDILFSIKEYHTKFGIISDFFFHSRPRKNQTIRKPLSKRGLQFIIESWGVHTLQGRRIHAHAIRHSVGQRLMEKAGSIAVQKVLNHSSPVISSKYYLKPFLSSATDLLTWE
ncbi:recombinase XerC [Leptospira hartskeerlii]|uniref:Recombinase XerC n=1 Tax=Leptospira hartskeerlii TaxID=2023177 RepID=A0A2M9X8C4_9LEPT|nr:tyrosine-type recombinase/integrase [Leptospira hartskeerlii]PJZ23951.1 recombinase XerC [Leptospira hartskeerlii]PJZ35215.1 recombinase XerC [Leptospira hartskeerlii]